jgi:hypothetical protein
MPSARLIISDDRLTASLLVEPGTPADQLTPEAVHALMDERGIAPAQRLNFAPELANLAPATLAEPARALVAQGKAPVHARDGTLELDANLHKPTQHHHDAETPQSQSESQAQSHYDRSAFRASTVKSGTKIGVILEPTIGEDGVDVTGRALAAKQGRPCKPLTDDTVEITARGEVFARADGIVEHSGNLLRVRKLLEVDNFVDFSTGNIDFPGDVRVAKGVRDCFTVRAGGSLDVGDLVEAATLHAALDARLERGMAARDKGSITVGRDLSAKYLSNVEGVVARDARIHKELTACRLIVGRDLIAPTAVVVAGELWIGRSGEVGQLGSDAGPAAVILGRGAELDTLMREAMDLLPLVQQRAVRARERLEQLQRATAKLTPQQAEELTELEFNLSTYQRQVGPVTSALGRVLRLTERLGRGRLIVHRKVTAGTTVWIGNVAAEFRAEVKGPIALGLDARGEPIVFNPRDESARPDHAEQKAPASAQPLTRHAKLLPATRFADLEQARTLAAA